MFVRSGSRGAQDPSPQSEDQGQMHTASTPLTA